VLGITARGAQIQQSSEAQQRRESASMEKRDSVGPKEKDGGWHSRDIWEEGGESRTGSKEESAHEARED